MFGRNRMIYTILFILLTCALVVVAYLQHPKFGRRPSGERLARMEQSPNYRGGVFHNQELTPQLTSDKSRMRTMYDFLFEKREHNSPQNPVPAIKSDLHELDRQKDLFVWFGHSSYLIQSGGVCMVIDPVFEDAAPLSFFNKPFEGSNIFSAEDMPSIDYLIITHDHWDHLDYATVKSLRERVSKVVCPLGVGEYFEMWGYSPRQIVEMDWGDEYGGDGFDIHCLTARHFSGRTLRANPTLWASYMVVTPRQTIYLSGDGGYGRHIGEIAQRFPHIDLAVLENGQYNMDWRYIHLMPEELPRVVEELRPTRVMAGHNGKYALSKHPWYEPLENAAALPSAFTPRIGEVVLFGEANGAGEPWWREVD